MLEIEHRPEFIKQISRIKDNLVKQKIKKQISKIIKNPEIGKPMRNARKDTREVYIKPYRLSYAYLKKVDKIVLLDFYHKDEQ